MIFRFHSAWLAVDSFISAAKLRGGNGGSCPPLDLLSQIHLKAHVHPRCIARPVLQKRHFA